MTDMPKYAYKVKAPSGHHRHSAPQTTGYKWILDTKRKTGNRLVLILKVGEPQKEFPKMMSPTTEAQMQEQGVIRTPDRRDMQHSPPKNTIQSM